MNESGRWWTPPEEITDVIPWLLPAGTTASAETVSTRRLRAESWPRRLDGQLSVRTDRVGLTVMGTHAEGV